jgi:hypothetical protein
MQSLIVSESSIAHLNEDLDRHFDRNRTNDYDRVACLTLYWEGAGSEYKEEALKVQLFFASKLKYSATLYEIPLEKPFWNADRAISHFIESVSDKRCLAIIHYGGHGDEDIERDQNRRQPRMSVWAARDDASSPRFSWSSIQKKLGESEGHVLLILDCCFAAQAARGNDRCAFGSR